MKKIITLALSIFILNQQAQTLNSNLVVCMPMNGNASDFSGNSNNGTLINSPTSSMDRNGNPNSAYCFNSTNQQYIDIPSSASINNIEANDELSICIWANVTAFQSPPGNNLFPLVEKYDTPSTDIGWSFALYGTSAIPFDISFAANGTQNLTTVNPITNGQWHFYVMTFSKSNNLYQLFIDGLLVTTSILPSGTQLYNTAGSVRVGFSQAGPQEYSYGCMDDLRIYNREITQSEITALYTLTNLTCASTTFTLPPPQDGCCLGNLCSEPQNQLQGDYEIPLDHFNFNFSGDYAQSSQKVNVGIPCGTIFPGKFNVTTALRSDPNSPGNSYSIYSTNTNATSGITKTGVYGSAASNVAGINRGLWGYANSETNAQGVFGKGDKGTRSYGGYFESITAGNNFNYGIYATASGAQTNYAGFFQGDIYVTGTPFHTSGGPWTASDSRFKKEVKQLEDVSEKIKKLRGYTYKFKVDEYKDKNFSSEEQIGMIAQELKEIFPQLVIERDGFNYVNYSGFIPVLLEGLKAEQLKNDQQQQQIDELKALVSSLAGNPNKSTGSVNTPVNLSDKTAVVLDQNVPNPFAESTVITYNIPSDFTRSQIIFTNNSGVIIKTVDIKEKGAGSLNVFANDLTNGMYTYTLVVDGKTVDSKKMVKH